MAYRPPKQDLPSPEGSPNCDHVEAPAFHLTNSDFELMVQVTGSAVVCLSPSRKIVRWNRGAEMIFGYAKEEVLGKDYFELFLPAEVHGAVDEVIKSVLKGSVSRNVENPVLTRDGSERILLWQAAPVTDEAGVVRAILGIGQDITELKRVEAGLSGENKVLELLVTGAAMEEVITALAVAAKSVCPELQCGVMMSDEEARTLRWGASVGLEDSFRDALDGVEIGPRGPNCARAADSRERSVSTDIAGDDVWGKWRQTALMSGIRASWSEPVLGGDGRRVLGTVDAYSERPRKPDAAELSAIQRTARLAAIAIDHRRAFEERLRETESRFENAVTELAALRKELQKKFSFDDVVAVSPAMLRVIHLASQVAPTDATVLITGETGTGKEVLARAIHANSPRRDGPFIAVNCGAIPETLMESELFGHERGAFTGADRRKPGQVERAKGGVLFLDEVGELVPAAQVKLLRVLQAKVFERLGGTETLQADVRIIAATNRDLFAEMEKGSFREDLYYRLNVFHIHIPPLRQRKEAIPVLADRILKRVGEQLGRPDIALSKLSLNVLTEYDWKGNVRELQNALERAAILCDGSLIVPEHLPIRSVDNIRATGPTQENEVLARIEPGFSMERFEQKLVRKALRLTRGNKSKAARLLGISRGSLRWRLDKSGSS